MRLIIIVVISILLIDCHAVREGASVKKELREELQDMAFVALLADGDGDGDGDWAGAWPARMAKRRCVKLGNLISIAVNAAQKAKCRLDKPEKGGPSYARAAFRGRRRRGCRR